MWQWIMNGPVWSVNRAATSTSSPGSRRHVSSRPRSHGGGRRPSRSIVRKGLEVPLTAAIELLWPKRRILEVYLNVAELGPGIYGAEAAARHYFNRQASELTQTQAARLAAVLPNPLEWSPEPPGNYVARRAGTIRTRINQLGPLLDCVRD